MKFLSFDLPGDFKIDPVAGMPTGGTDTLSSIIQFITTLLFVIATLLALGFLIYGGIKWITSGGDKAGVESARKTITYAIVGLVIAFLAFFIINMIGSFFGVTLLRR